MDRGFTPTTPVVDEPVTINGWTPENYTKKYLGLIDLQYALAESVNTVAARLADQVGRGNVAAMARRMGVTSKLNTDPAMALGTAEMTPLDMAQGYIPFSNGGVRSSAYGIKRIRTASGKVLYQYRPDETTRNRAIGNPQLQYMNQMLRGVLTRGTGTGAQIAGYDLAGKTGTTSDYRDAWFVGYTGNFVTVVWVGRDDNTVMTGKVTGGGTPAAIWKNHMTSALKRIQVSPIPSGPAATNLGPAAEDALGNLLGSQAGTAQSAVAPPPANDNPSPPIVTMQPIPNPEEKPKPEDKSLDELFSDAQRKSQ
jgi:penicillin-binding protein 1A